MRQFVESLKRLYKDNKIKSEKILKMYTEKKLTKDEYEYILGGNFPV